MGSGNFIKNENAMSDVLFDISIFIFFVIGTTANAISVNAISCGNSRKGSISCVISIFSVLVLMLLAIYAMNHKQ